MDWISRRQGNTAKYSFGSENGARDNHSKGQSEMVNFVCIGVAHS